MLSPRVLAIAAAAIVVTGCGSGWDGPGESAVTVIDALLAAPAAYDAAPAIAAVVSCVDDGDPVAEAALRARVTYLASAELAGREVGSPGEALAREHVAARFACLGLVPAGDDGGYLQAFTDKDRATANVIGVVPGADPVVGREVIVVGAHMDHVGTDGIRIWYGANDNASGVAAMLAVAQLVRQRSAPPRRTIVFIGFGAEETGLNGSQFMIEHPPEVMPLAQVAYMVNLDMVGSYASKHRVQAFGAFAGLPARALLKQLVPTHPGLAVRLGQHSERSDQAGFCAAGIPYVFLWTPDTRCYHRTCDTADRLDYPMMSAIAQIAGELALALANEPADLLASRARTGCGKPR